MLVERFCGRKLSGERVGIEIEVEFQDGEMPFNPELSFWRVVEEGSIRGGLELVSRPLSPEQIKPALEEIKEHYLEQCEFSDRCSIHVHTNMTNISTFGVVKYCLSYLSLERALIPAYNMRSNNNYCVPMYVMYQPLGFARNLKRGRSSIVQNYNKYCALNLLPLLEYGTVEWRGMGLLTDPEQIEEWAILALEVRKLSQAVNIPKFVEGGAEYLQTVAEEQGLTRVSSLINNYIQEVNIGCVHAISEVKSCVNW